MTATLLDDAFFVLVLFATIVVVIALFMFVRLALLHGDKLGFSASENKIRAVTCDEGKNYLAQNKRPKFIQVGDVSEKNRHGLVAGGNVNRKQSPHRNVAFGKQIRGHDAETALRNHANARPYKRAEFAAQKFVVFETYMSFHLDHLDDDVGQKQKRQNLQRI